MNVHYQVASPSRVRSELLVYFLPETDPLRQEQRSTITEEFPASAAALQSNDCTGKIGNVITLTLPSDPRFGSDDRRCW